MTREEYRQRKRQQERERRRKEREAWEAARGPLDLPFLLLALLLLGIGLIMLLSASFPSAQASKGTNYDPLYYFKRQGIFAGLGLFAMFWVSKINYERFRGLAKLGIIVSVVLLVLVLIPGVGITRNNATRWLGVPGIDSGQFQPSEVAKVGVIVFFAEFISKKREKMSTLKEGLLPLGLLLAFVAALIGLEPHLSGAILVLGIGAAMMMVGGIHWGWIAAGVTGLCTGWYVLANTDIVESVLKYNVSRLITWKDPWWDIQDKSFQTAQSLITIGSGGLLGLGLGKGRQKFMFLPEEHNDYIFAVVFEELGLVGGTLIMVLFALLIIRGFWLAIHARDRFGSLLIVGVTTQIALQTFLNIAVVTNLIPATGISLPFFSYGGTALAIQLAEVGIVLSVSRQIPAPKAG